MHLHDLSVKKIRQGLMEKKFSAFEIARAFLDYAEEKNKDIGAYLRLTENLALEEANRVDIALAEGKNPGALAGVPLAVKDNILIEGELATAASKILENYRAAYDATVVKKLKATGAALLGKTNMDEFAMGSSTENSAFQLTKNPGDLERVPGGSSGGSAAAVAANMAIGALGSDTGGSIRQPAGFCGVVGLKPTYGAVSRYGLMAMASSLDQIGVFAKTVEDAAILFKEIAGHDPLDATGVETEYGGELLNPTLEQARSLRVGVPKEYFVAGMENEVAAAMDSAITSLKSLKLEFKEISLPHTKYALSCYYIIMPAEVSANLARFDGIRYGEVGGVSRAGLSLFDLYKQNRGRGFGAEAKRRIILGTFILSAGYYDAYYAKAQKVRSLIKNDFNEAFKEVDVILTPVSPTVAFKIGEKVNDPLAMYLSDIFTIPVNLAGLPAVSVPVRKSGLPVGFQLIGKRFREADILAVGRFYEKIFENR
ncbi:MAG: Asp-tRNA(Asn)/Glu-tRNA(Gln) amidotransferase subunit GatA [Parcubacteria group bacterium]|nr:Asp-tRNA(Asn)/Glu-tRNA(Gln) amidotransferase subunit GatA [Parcubacteria group bacterium]